MQCIIYVGFSIWIQGKKKVVLKQPEYMCILWILVERVKYTHIFTHNTNTLLF